MFVRARDTLSASARSWRAFRQTTDLAETAHQLLKLFEESLENHREHLARLLREEPEAGV